VPKTILRLEKISGKGEGIHPQKDYSSIARAPARVLTPSRSERGGEEKTSLSPSTQSREDREGRNRVTISTEFEYGSETHSLPSNVGGMVGHAHIREGGKTRAQDLFSA